MIYCSHNIYNDGHPVIICDGSDVHGDKGNILWTQENGMIIVELESGVCWPVEESDIKPVQ